MKNERNVRKEDYLVGELYIGPKESNDSTFGKQRVDPKERAMPVQTGYFQYTKSSQKCRSNQH